MNAEILIRVIRGIIGVAIAAAGIMYENWIGLAGILLVMSAITGRCGISGSGCRVRYDNPEIKDKITD